MQDPRVIVALDYDNKDTAMAFIDKLDPTLCKLKVGKEMFTLFGPEFVKEIIAKGFDVFLDLKFHDIPNTVAKACKAAAELGVWMVNVHASGGLPMMQAAKEAIANSANPSTKLIAVTVLTSMDQEDLKLLGSRYNPLEAVASLAAAAKECGLHGVVCSPLEASTVRKIAGDDFMIITPGVRPAGAATSDQKRVKTPAEAIKAGATALVIGRPVTGSDNPALAVKTILQQIEEALNN